MSPRSFHRIVATTIVVFTLYFSVTGATIQVMDLRTLARHAAATDPDMMAIRESLDGPSNFSVIKPTDYAAPAFPKDYDFSGALVNVMKGVRAIATVDLPLRYIELRIVDQKPSGLALLGDRVFRFSPADGAMLSNLAAPLRTGPSPSMRNKIKNWHRLHVFGDGVLWLNALVGIALLTMVVSGLMMYYKLLRAASRVGRVKAFWFSGGWWRSMHRWVSAVAALFLVVVAVSGTLLSIDSLSLFIYRVIEPPDKLVMGLFPIGMTQDESSPLQDTSVPGMLRTTLAAFHEAQGDVPIKVVRLRNFAGMAQGMIIGGGEQTRQLAFNALTAQPVGATEPGYPYTGFPFGWEEHEIMKKIHRGDILGLPGRFMDLFAGLSLVFLSLSGLVMYLNLRNSRKRAGRKQLFWM